MTTTGLAWLGFAFVTVFCWGLYGTMLHAGQVAMGDPVNGAFQGLPIRRTGLFPGRRPGSAAGPEEPGGGLDLSGAGNGLVTGRRNPGSCRSLRRPSGLRSERLPERGDGHRLRRSPYRQRVRLHDQTSAAGRDLQYPVAVCPGHLAGRPGRLSGDPLPTAGVTAAVKREKMDSGSEISVAVVPRRRIGDPPPAGHQVPAQGNAAGGQETCGPVRGRGIGQERHPGDPLRHRKGQDIHREPLRSGPPVDPEPEGVGQGRPAGGARLRADRGPVLLHPSAASAGDWGDAIRCARRFTQNRPFVVALGDSIIGLDSPTNVVSAMTRIHRESGGGLRGRRRDRFSSRHTPVWDRGTG